MKRRLGSFEKAQALTNENFPFNAVIILRVKNGPCVDTLGKALKIIQQKHPGLRVHIKNNKGKYFFESEGTPDIPLKVVNKKNDSHWKQVAEDELNQGVDYLKGPLVRVNYLVGRDKQENDIIMTFHHAMVDASSATYLIDEILLLCQKIREGVAVEEVEKLDFLPPSEEFFPPLFKGIRRSWKCFIFVLRQMRDEFFFQVRSRGKRKPPIHKTGRGKIFSMILSDTETEKICKASRKERVTLNSMLNAAILIAVHKVLYKKEDLPLRHIQFADLRPYLVPPLESCHLGGHFSMMRFTTHMDKDCLFWDVAREINQMSYNVLKRGDKYCSNLLSYPMMKAILSLKKFRMATTAISYTGLVLLDKNYGSIEVRDLHTFASNFTLGPEYTAQVRMFNSKIYWDMLYLDSDMDQKIAEEISNEIRKNLVYSV